MNDPHYLNRIAQIGNICAQWSALEYHAALAIWNLCEINDPEVGKILTASLDLKQRLSMAFALSHVVNAPIPFKNAIKTLQTALYDENLIHLRNQAVHGIHFAIDEPAAIGIEMHRGKGGRGQRVQYDKDLKEMGDRLKVLRDDFSAVVTKALDERKAALATQAEMIRGVLTMMENSAATKSLGD